jgi:DNA-binding transcriptional regulator YdaS (Cro superfamily)
MDELKRAIKLVGSQAQLAERMNQGRPPEEHVGGSAIGNWLIRGKVPPEHVIAVSRAVNWEVVPHRLAPEIYPHEEDGLPPVIRARMAAEAVNAQLARTRQAIEQGGQQIP